MLLAGDEFGHTQKGNNNAYAQDNEITWLDWNAVTADGVALRDFTRSSLLCVNGFRSCIAGAFRQASTTRNLTSRTSAGFRLPESK